MPNHTNVTPYSIQRLSPPQRPLCAPRAFYFFDYFILMGIPSGSLCGGERFRERNTSILSSINDTVLVWLLIHAAQVLSFRQ